MNLESRLQHNMALVVRTHYGVFVTGSLVQRVHFRIIRTTKKVDSEKFTELCVLRDFGLANQKKNASVKEL